MQKERHHSPAYVGEVGTAWRVIVPIRGRLSPMVLADRFQSKCAALDWLYSEEGEATVSSERTRIRQITVNNGHPGHPLRRISYRCPC
jgi:hypothetical protein